MLFNLPTLVTLTSPTCGGKNFLLERLVTAGFGRIVSTTDRPARAGEVEGVHYFFITKEQSQLMEEQNLFAELVTYNGVRYGVTREEMDLKMNAGHPPIVILEPSGLDIYRKYCASKGWAMFSVFVDTPESVRLERLVDRTTHDLMSIILGVRKPGSFGDAVKDVVQRSNKRLQAIFQEERSWRHHQNWDVIADGENVERAMAQISMGIINRNQRSSIFS